MYEHNITIGNHRIFITNNKKAIAEKTQVHDTDTVTNFDRKTAFMDKVKDKTNLYPVVTYTEETTAHFPTTLIYIPAPPEHTKGERVIKGRKGTIGSHVSTAYEMWFKVIEDTLCSNGDNIKSILLSHWFVYQIDNVLDILAALLIPPVKFAPIAKTTFTLKTIYSSKLYLVLDTSPLHKKEWVKQFVKQETRVFLNSGAHNITANSAGYSIPVASTGSYATVVRVPKTLKLKDIAFLLCVTGHEMLHAVQFLIDKYEHDYLDKYTANTLIQHTGSLVFRALSSKIAELESAS